MSTAVPHNAEPLMRAEAHSNTFGSSAHRAAAMIETDLEVSVVMPCLNEAETLADCIERAQRAMASSGIRGEVVVADNGSVDGSQAIALHLGAQLAPVAVRGYGAALMGGIEAARGRWVIMGDADGSYDFGQIPAFVARLREGAEIVQGCRLPTGGGHVMPGAMPLLHRWWGNPMFSAMARLWFAAPVHDLHCGMRGFSRRAVLDLDLRCTGMEFASEMIVKAILQHRRIAEVPITLHRDGRSAHPPHLRTFRDGWRHLRFLLMYSPRWLYVVPGTMLIALGALAGAVAMPRASIGGITFDVHTLLFASLAIICGYQALLYAALTKVFAVNERLLPRDAGFDRLFSRINLERGLVAGACAAITGALLLTSAVFQWVELDFGSLDYGVTMRWVIPGMLLMVIGVQTVLSAFFLSILGMNRR